MRGNDLCNEIDNGCAALKFCGVGVSLRDTALEAVFAPKLEILFKADATLADALPVDVPRFENEGRIGQHTGRSDLVDRRVEIERGRRYGRVEALGDCDDAFHRRPGHRLIACCSRRQPQHCRGCSNGREPRDSERADHGVALRTSLFSTVPVSPCTLAPRVSCQPPSMLRVALNLYTPGSVLGIGVTLVAISCIPSGAISRRVAKMTALDTGFPSGLWTSRTEMVASPFLTV